MLILEEAHDVADVTDVFVLVRCAILQRRVGPSFCDAAALVRLALPFPHGLQKVSPAPHFDSASLLPGQMRGGVLTLQ